MSSMRQVIWHSGLSKLSSQKTTLFNEGTMKRFTLPLFLITIVSLSGCAGMSETQQRTLSGTTMGAAGGAAIGAIAGNAALGAGIGAAAGLLGGYLYDQHEKSKEKAYQEGYQQGRSSSP